MRVLAICLGIVALYSVGIGFTFEHEARTASDYDKRLPPIYLGAIFWPIYWPAQLGRYVFDGGR